MQYADEITALENLFGIKNKQRVDLTFLEVKQDFKLNPKATFEQAKTEVMQTLRNSVRASYAAIQTTGNLKGMSGKSKQSTIF